MLVMTVDEKKSAYSERDVQKAQLARKIQHILGHPSTKQFLQIIGGNQLPNCPIGKEDIIAAENIFGKSVAGLKGKTTRHKPTTVTGNYMPLPLRIVEKYHNVTLAFDIMYVNKIAFLVTLSRNIRFGTAERLPSRNGTDVVKALKAVVKIYKARGFKVSTLLGDGEFEPLRSDVYDMGCELNVTSNDEHVGDIERYIRTIKERARASFHLTPFQKMPPLMIQDLIGGCVFWLNVFPNELGISDTMSPRTILSGKTIDYKRHCRIMFGAYAQVHEEHDNSLQTRTAGAIALRPTGNEQGGFYFMSLATGRRLNRNHWHELPMPKDVIDRVHKMARRSYVAKDLVFQLRDGDPVDEDDESAADPDYEPSIADDEGDEPSITDDEDDDIREEEPHDEESHVSDESVNEDSGVMSQFDDPKEDGSMQDDHDEPGGNDDEVSVTANQGAEEHADEFAGVPELEQNETIDEDGEFAEVPEPAGMQVVNVDDVNRQGDQEDDELDQRYGKREHGYSLRPRKPRSYKHRHADLEDVIMTQLSLKKGLVAYGEEGAKAVTSELKQLHDKAVMTPRAANLLTREEKRRALQYLMYLKKKRCGRIKGRGCADGRKQRVYKSKEESSSPTVAIESLFLTAIIDAKERRDVATCDIPGAFLHADIDEVLHMRIDGPMAKLLVDIDPDLYEPYLTEENGKPVIYVKLEKALYGTLQAALLFWRNLSGFLMEHGFELNPYDECVANKIVNGTQCTIVWHVDDLKIAHVDPQVVSNVIELLQQKYGTVDAPLTVCRGMIYDYLGMTLDYTVPGKVMINMDHYVNELLDEVPADMRNGTSTTPAAAYLYDVNEDAEKLNQERIDTFHTITAKLLFLSKRARPDLQQAVGFLTTRVKCPDTDDWKKLCRVIKYLRGTAGLKLTLEADDAHVIKWWVDAAFGVHNDMRSQTGMTMTMGKGSVYASSVRQKLNTRSSTEAELVGADDAIGMILWTRLFLENQGYMVRDTKLYQDNQSAMLLEKNGKRSSSKRTRHINIRYFFITDCIEKGEVKVEYCPTEDMLADIFTKPLQGNAFHKFRNAVLNMQPCLTADPHMGRTTHGSQECVEKSCDGLYAVRKDTKDMEETKGGYDETMDRNYDLSGRA
jgi:hypothetical protein